MLPERLPLLRIVERELERRLREPDRFGRVRYAGAEEGVHRAVKSALADEEVFFRNLAVLEDELAWTIRDDRDGESRLVTLGMDSLARILVVVHVRREARVRLVSARKATAGERARYLVGRGKGRGR